MNILLYGAISASNFGDCIFADLFYNTIKRNLPDDNIWFYDKPPYGISNYLREQLNYDYIMSDEDYKKVDVLVYISGGYFGEDEKSLKKSIIRYKRYVTLGNKYISRNIPILVVGLEVGPIYYRFLKKGIERILRNAKVLTVRNRDSLQYCKERMSVNNAILTQDTAIQIARGEVPGNYDYLDDLFVPEKKSIFLHVPYNPKSERYIENILQPVIKFCKVHKEYYIIYGMDNLEQTSIKEFVQLYFEKEPIIVKHYNYKSYWEMCMLLSRVDLIVTTKLHVGIVGSSFGKAIISTPVHRFKTERFYNEIGFQKNTCSFYSLTPDRMSDLLEENYKSNVTLSDSVFHKSKSNLDIMLESLKRIKETKRIDCNK